MKMNKWFTAALTALVVLCATAALAAPKLEVKITAQKEVTTVTDGKSEAKLIVADTGYPGETILYTLSYENVGDSNAVGASFVDPVPAGTSYLPGSATFNGAELTFSADGGKNYMADGMVTYKVSGTDGKESDKKAAPEEYTHLKWKITAPIPAGGSGSFQFKAKVK